MEGRVVLGIDPGTNFMGYGVIKIENGKPHLVVHGVIRLNKFSDPYQKLGHIFERVSGIITSYHPSEVALEAPFYGTNVQSMLKLGRAQGVAMAAALARGIDVFEYAPTKVKQAISGVGRASKEQVA
ncbi:MAG: crossover junction endodeoxyribonuclease RuvC, partial [Mucinivorans sp.]